MIYDELREDIRKNYLEKLIKYEEQHKDSEELYNVQVMIDAVKKLLKFSDSELILRIKDWIINKESYIPEFEKNPEYICLEVIIIKEIYNKLFDETITNIAIDNLKEFRGEG